MDGEPRPLFVSWMLELDDLEGKAPQLSVSESCEFSLNDFDGESTPSALTSSLLSSLNELESEPTPSTMPETFGDAINPSFLDVATLFSTFATAS